MSIQENTEGMPQNVFMCFFRVLVRLQESGSVQYLKEKLNF